MPDYHDLQLSANPEEIRQDAVDWITDHAPAGFVITPLLDWLISAAARMASLIVVLASRVPKAIVQIVGEQLLGVTVLEATAATGTVEFTAVDTDGHTVPEGSQLDIQGRAFITVAPAIIPAASTTATAPIMAVDAGADGSGLTGPAELISPPLIWLAGVELQGTTIGGVDGETPDEYVERFADETPTLSTKAILIRDFEALARRDLEVARALAIDNFVPPSTTGVAGAVTVALVTAEGTAVSSAARARVEATLEEDRALNLDVHVIDPTFTDVDVAFTITARAGYDTAAVADEAEAAIAEFLSPARWGLPPESDQDAWVDEPIVVRNDLIGVLYDVPGVRHVSALTVGETGGALAASDLTLDTPAALPRAQTVTATVA